MMSVKALKNSGEAGKYYSKADYYTKGEENVDIKSGWYGNGSELLGLSGAVSQSDFEKLLEGELPNGIKLGTMRNGEWKHQPGWDFTMSAPKSVSILALVGGDNRLLEAHQKAVKETLDYIQEHLMKSQTNNADGRGFTETPNAIIAQFTHTTSREHDPQLHTHNVIMNAAATHDEEWRSVYSRNLFNSSKMLGMIYQNALGELVQELGYTPEWNTEHGTFELKELSREEIMEYSKRRQQIEKHAEENGLTTPKEMDKAATDTRKSKQNRPSEEIIKEWDERASARNFDFEEKVSTAEENSKVNVDERNDNADANGNKSSNNKEDVNPEPTSNKNSSFLEETSVKSDDSAFGSAYDTLLIARNVLADTEQVFTKEQLMEMTLRLASGRYSSKDILSAQERLIQEKELIVSAKDDGHFTTAQAINSELNVLDYVAQNKGKYDSLASEKQIDKAIFDASFTAGQESSFRDVLSTKDKFMGLQGFAGVGKTYMMNPVISLAKRNGYTVKGMAPNGQQAEVLQKETGINAQTVKSFIMELDSGENKPSKKELWVLDEAGQLNAKDMETLVKHASLNKGVKVVLSGDKAQLGSIEAGRIFSTMIKGGMDHTVNNDIIRQKDERHKAAVYAFTRGDVKGAFEQLDPYVKEIKNDHERFTAMRDQFLKEMDEHGKMPMAVVPNNEGRDKFDEMLRNSLKERGELGKEDTIITTLRPGKVDGSMKRHAYFYKTDMVIRFNAKLAGINAKSGEYFRIVEIKGDHLILENYNQQGDVNKRISLDPSKTDFKDYQITNYVPKERSMAVGDKIIWKDKTKQQGLLNGYRGTITAIENGMLTVDFGEHGTRVINSNKDQERHFEHAYSDTSYAGQGKTEKHRNLVMAESWRRNLVTEPATYVNASRGAEGVMFFTNDKKDLVQRVMERHGQKSESLEHVTKFQAEQLRRPPEQRKGLLELLGIKRQQKFQTYEHDNSFYKPISTFHDHEHEDKSQQEHARTQRTQQHERSK